MAADSYGSDAAREGETLREKLTRQGEDAVAKVVQDLARSPIVGEAMNAAMRVGEKASKAQEATLGAMQIPTAADIERITRRIRSVSNRIEEIEDGIDRLEHKGDSGQGGSSDVEKRLGEIEKRLDTLHRDLAGLKPPSKPKPAARKPAAKSK